MQERRKQQSNRQSQQPAAGKRDPRRNIRHDRSRGSRGAPRPLRAPAHVESLPATDSLQPKVAIERALEKRVPLLDSQTNAFRLVHDYADQLPGFVVEKLAHVLVAQLHEGRARHLSDAYRAALAPHLPQLGATAAYLKVFPRDRSRALPRLERDLHSPAPWIGAAAAAEHVVTEDGIRFLVRPYDGYAAGLFLDHRTNRRLVRRLAGGRRVLNGFSYTCGHSIAAALGEARGTASVDVSKRHLEWGKRNFAENGLALDRAHLFFCGDMLEYYGRAARRRDRFGLIILDPPAFARVKESRRTFQLERDIGPLLTGAIELLEPRGLLLLSINQRTMPMARIEGTLREAAMPRRMHVVERPDPPPGFEGDPDFLKSLLARID